MPNHVTNKLKLFGEQSRIEKLLRTVKYDDGEIGTLDFNKIIPMPDSLNMTSGSVKHDAINAYLSAVNPDNIGFENIKKMDRETFGKVCDKINSHYYITKCKTNLEAGEIADVLDRYSEIGDVMSLEYDKTKHKTCVHTLWTQAGRMFLYDKLKEQNILPLCERSAA